MQARDAFFAHYATSRCWDFLKPYYHPLNAPKHLTLAIEAVSLAYLWHQVYSDVTLATARQKYISALRMTKNVLKSPIEATKATTLMASLLLDLFEKITDSEPRHNKSWISHIDGALALVQHRGLEHFQDPSELTVLFRLSTHYITSCVASGSPVPDVLNAIRDYVEQHRDCPNPMLRLSNLMIQYANLRSEIHKDALSDDENVELCVELDDNIQALEIELPPSWQYTTTNLQHESNRVFEFRFDTYANPRVCQARNILRVIRIILNESLLKHHLASPMDDNNSARTSSARGNIAMLTRELCACAPQYVDCDLAARHRLPIPSSSFLPQTPPLPISQHSSSISSHHTHTPNHQLDCYTLIFPLYVAGRLNAIPEVRPWVIKQLHYLSSHFCIRNAAIVARLLEQGTKVEIWDVYAMLGSYAFAS